MHGPDNVGNKKIAGNRNQPNPNIGGNNIRQINNTPMRTGNESQGASKSFFSRIYHFFFPTTEMKAEREIKRAGQDFEKSAKSLINDLSIFIGGERAVDCCINIMKQAEKLDPVTPLQGLVVKMDDVLCKLPPETLQKVWDNGKDTMLGYMKESVKDGVEGQRTFDKAASRNFGGGGGGGVDYDGVVQERNQQITTVMDTIYIILENYVKR